MNKRGMAGERWFVSKTATIALALALLLGAVSCSSEVEQIREGTLSDVEIALTAAQELSQSAGTDGRYAEGLSRVLLSLEQAATILMDNTERSDDRLAQSLTHLLEADRLLVGMEGIDGEAASNDLAKLMAPVRSAAQRLYEHIYGVGASSGGDEWRGPPTPRPPGACPGG
jgi:hypothetical protein